MYKIFLISELKNWARDPMTRFMLIYPIIFGLFGRYLLPRIADMSGFFLEAFADFILAFLAMFIPQIYGALLGFSLLDDRDDNVMPSIRVTPLSLHQFFSFKVAITLVLSFIAAIFVLWFVDIGGLSWSKIFLVSFLASLGTPINAFLINALSRNKIEGFAVMKGIGTLIVFPIIALFFTDAKEFFFAFVPAFWPVKAISVIIRGTEALPLSFPGYFIIGLGYVLILNVLVYRFFLQKIRT